ncbi:unnamed protein product [Prorocentrum cordatum]|uniref:SAC3/GANP/THP3 conserved domain-containing protein n=1 Tax=Prorocentrum cordatum TaxID=2364126 RepID=A0ABN9VN56_9DINO|nr:unnamed protein product [Polarella glacialis]
MSMQDYRGNTKELADELQRAHNVSGKRFRALFNQTLNQYAQWFYTAGGGARGAAQFGRAQPLAPGPLSNDEHHMRAARADRFKTHLDKAAVAMVSFNDGENAMVNGGPITGQLDEMCSRHEAKEREMTRQLDKFEWKQGTDPKHPEVNLALATRKYQRSSADKAYKSSETRTLAALWRTMQFLMTQILDFDTKPKPQFAVQRVPYIQCYSYLRDRTRAIRVELHLQQPRSTTQRTFLESHECCLRFELLTIYLLTRDSAAASGDTTEKYDPKLGLKAISQTIEPLLNAYQAVKAKLLAKSILAEAMGGFGLDEGDGEEQEHCSSYEMAMHRYIILLLMSFSPEGIGAHLAKLDREVISHPLISFATQAYAAFQTEDFGRFLHFYREADFLTAVAMSGIADLARLRVLFMLFRTYPQPVGDRVPLSRLKTILACSTDAHLRQFLTHHGVAVEQGASGSHVVLPKKGTPQALSHPMLSGPNKLPEKCDFPKGRDSLLDAKYAALGLSRADVVFGLADPVVEAPAAEPELPAEELELRPRRRRRRRARRRGHADVAMPPTAGPAAEGAREAAGAGGGASAADRGGAPAEAAPDGAG